jgi:archaellum biogenesis ATPase FlaH
MNIRGNASGLKTVVKEHFSVPSNIKSFYESELSVNWNGKNQGMALCPFHQDSKPSLSVDTQTGLFHCFGCEAKGDPIDFFMKRFNLSFPEAVRQIAEKVGISKPQRKISKIYDYLDAEGKLIFQVCRFEPKGFSQRRPDPDNKGKWIWNLQGIELVPYNLPELIKSNYCILVEGEKDCGTLRNIGLVASCNSGGAGKWKESYNEYFRGKRIYILSDNDMPGKDHAQMVASSLKGVAESIKVIELPGLPEKGDVSDWIAQGNTKEMLVELCKNAPEWTPTKMSEQDKSVASQNCLPEDKSVASPQEAEKTLLSSLLKWNDIHAINTETEYLLDKLIPEGAITLLFGKGGIGKTSLCLQIIHAIAEGKNFMGLHTKQTPVIYIDRENPLRVLRDRIKNIGESNNILIWHGSCEPSPAKLDKQEYVQYFGLPKGLIVFDTLRASFLGDENNSRDIAIIVDRLKELRDRGFTILLLHHTPKGNDGIYKGSTAILDLVDHALCLEPIKEDDEPIDFDPERMYRFGVKIKTRFEPHHVFLKFNPDIKGFDVARDPDVERIEAIYEILKGSPEGLKQKSFKEKIKSELDLTEPQIRRLLKKGEGMAWDVQRGGSGKENRALIYTPKFDRMIGQPIYSHPIIPSNPERDKSLSNQALLNSQQIIDNACLADRIDSVQPINTTNHSINTSNRCSDCLLTAKQRLLCEVKKPCPKGVV